MLVRLTSNIQGCILCYTFGGFLLLTCSVFQPSRHSRRSLLTGGGGSFVAQQWRLSAVAFRTVTVPWFCLLAFCLIIAVLSNSSFRFVTTDLADLAGSKYVQNFARKVVLPTLLIARLILAVVRTLNYLSTATCPEQSQKFSTFAATLLSQSFVLLPICETYIGEPQMHATIIFLRVKTPTQR